MLLEQNLFVCRELTVLWLYKNKKKYYKGILWAPTNIMYTNKLDNLEEMDGQISRNTQTTETVSGRNKQSEYICNK